MADGNLGGAPRKPALKWRLPWLYRTMSTLRMVQLALRVSRRGLNKPIKPGDTIVLTVTHSVTWDSSDA